MTPCVQVPLVESPPEKLAIVTGIDGPFNAESENLFLGDAA